MSEKLWRTNRTKKTKIISLIKYCCCPKKANLLYFIGSVPSLLTWEFTRFYLIYLRGLRLLGEALKANCHRCDWLDLQIKSITKDLVRLYSAILISQAYVCKLKWSKYFTFISFHFVFFYSFFRQLLKNITRIT